MDKLHKNGDFDSPEQTILHGQLIKEKPFLNKLYHDWYKFLLNRINIFPDGRILELGSGGGFLKKLLPDVITSDIIDLPSNDMTFSAENMPFENNSLSAIFMIDVLHHIPNCKAFFSEAQRTLKLGGMVIMSEPANTILSRFFYQNFHHENFDPSGGWKIEDSTGPLSGANGAIPWIVFKRDVDIFHKEYPNLRLEIVQLHSPLMYFLSGGLSHNQLVPSFTYNFFKGIEKLLTPLNSLIGMFQLIVVKKI